MTCHPAYVDHTHRLGIEGYCIGCSMIESRKRADAARKECGHTNWCACTRYWRHDAVQSLGDRPQDREADSVHRAHQPVREDRVGAEGPLRRLDATDVGIRQGDRVIVRDHYGFGPGTARGPVTLDNEGLWYVTFDTEYADTFDYHLLERSHDV